jgi:hypothetical protein
MDRTEATMLGEISQAQKNKYHMFSLTCGTQTSNDDSTTRNNNNDGNTNANSSGRICGTEEWKRKGYSGVMRMK